MLINKILVEIYTYFFADRMIGKYYKIKAQNSRVNLFDYHPEFSKGLNRFNDSRYNLGDYLGFVVTSFMLEKKGLSLDTRVKKRKHFYCVGSNVFTGYQFATYWGSGLIREPQITKEFLYQFPLSKFDFRAVRGPLTRKWVMRYGHKCPEIYGDPAILMPLIYQPKHEVKHDLLVIPQFVTETDFRKEHPNLFMVSMNTDDYKLVIDAIVSSKKVVTNSLHAIILADAYGVPSVLFKVPSQKNGFKYLDYYYSTERYDIKLADSYEEAMQMDPLPLPNLESLQEGLLKSFPYDLWED